MKFHTSYKWLFCCLACVGTLWAAPPDSTDTPVAPPVISGYTQIQFKQFLREPKKDIQSGFDVNRVRFAFSGDLIPERLSYAIEFDPQGSPILDDTYLDWTLNDQMKIRAGRYKIPFGAENPTGEDELDLIEKSQVVESVFSAREIGLGYYYEHPWLNGDAGYFQKAEDGHIERDVIGRLGLKPFAAWFEIGGSGYFEQIHTDSTQFLINRVGLDSRLTAGPIKLQGEWILSKGTLDDTDISGFGYYAYASFTHKIGQSDISWIGRYEFYDPDRHADGDRETKYVAGATIAFHKRMRVQINYQHIRTDFGSPKKQNKIIAQYQFNF